MNRFHLLRYPMLCLLSGLLVVSGVQAEPVKLAVLLPLSSMAKHLGVEAKNGFLLGIQEEASAQHIDVEAWVTFEFLDTRVDPEHSLRLARDAIANGAKAILGLVSSRVGLQLRDYVLDQARVPLVLFGGAMSSKLRTTHPLFLRVSVVAPQIGIALASWLTTHPIVPGDKPRWACIHWAGPTGPEMCDGFRVEYRQVGEDLGRVSVPFKTINLTKEIVQLKKLQPDFVLATVLGSQAVLFFQTYYRFNMHQHIPLVALGVHSLVPYLEKTLQEYDTGVGLLNVSSWSLASENQASQRFVARYHQTYNERPSELALYGYDTGRLLVKALTHLQGRWDGQQVVHLMKTLPVTSPRHGQPLQFDSHGDPISPAYIFMMKRDGNRLVNERLGEIPPINLDRYKAYQ